MADWAYPFWSDISIFISYFFFDAYNEFNQDLPDSQQIAAVEWNELGNLHDDYTMATVSTPRAQTPPSNPTEVSSTAKLERWNGYVNISEVHVSGNAFT